MHDFERNVDQRNLKAFFVYYQKQCLGSKPKLFRNNPYNTTEIDDYIFKC